jgi:hypothetical protein
MAAISSRLSVRVPQRSLNNRNAEGDGVYSLVCQGSYSGCGEDPHQVAVARVEHARFHGVNRSNPSWREAAPKKYQPRDGP